jgi:hypothetical protein
MYDEMWKFKPTAIYLRDSEYRAIPFSDFVWLMEQYAQPMPKYAKEIFDCDDFTTCLRADILRGWASLSRGNEALPFGWVNGKDSEGQSHAWMWCRDDKGIYHWIEPQTLRLMIGRPQAFHVFEG